MTLPPIDEAKWNQAQMALNYGLRYNQSDACKFMAIVTGVILTVYCMYYYVVHVFLAD